VRPQERGWCVYSRCLGGGGKWTWQGSITAPETAQTDRFSRGLAIAGNEMFVGAPGLELPP
jgi:hypothetical protein